MLTNTIVVRPSRAVTAVLAGLALLALPSALSGCSTGASASARSAEATGMTTRELRVRDHEGGTHHRAIVHDGAWYQTFSNELLAIDPRNGRVTERVELIPFDEGGPATDLVVADGRLWVVILRSGVAELDISDPAHPSLVTVHDSQSLLLQPRRVSSVRGDLFVSGVGGVRRWSDGAIFLGGGATYGPVIDTPQGLVTCTGHDLVRLDDGAYVGSAVEVSQLPSGMAGDGSGARYLFARQAGMGAQLGLLGPDLMEVTSTAIPGTLRSVRAFNNRLWAVTDRGVFSAGVEGDRLTDEREFSVRGARDVAPVSENVLAVSGSFGRALYRIDPADGRPGDTFFAVQREPSSLLKAISDRRRVLAGSDEGNWLYRIGDKAELTDRELDFTSVPSTSATLDWGSAAVAPDGRGVRILASGVETLYRPSGAPVIGCLREIDGDLWIGHESGIDVVGVKTLGTPEKLGSVRFEGVVRWIFPKWDGGGVYVSDFGGFGTIDFVERPMTPEEVQAQLAQQAAAAKGASGGAATSTGGGTRGASAPAGGSER